MGTAQVQGNLWGLRAQDYATLIEECFRPVYETVLAAAEVGAGTRLLDVGCGPGLAAHIAAGRGAQVAGLDAAETSVALAQARTPAGDFRVGEMEDLPWPDQTFDVVTGFNAFQYPADRINALREARRVTRPGGRVVVVVWGRAEDCETAATIAAVGKLMPPPPPGAEGPFALAAPGRVEALMEEAGLTPVSSGEADFAFEFPDLETAVHGHMSAGVMVAAAQKIGDEALRQAISESLAVARTSTGGYRQRNRLHYVIGRV